MNSTRIIMIMLFAVPAMQYAISEAPAPKPKMTASGESTAPKTSLYDAKLQDLRNNYANNSSLLRRLTGTESYKNNTTGETAVVNHLTRTITFTDAHTGVKDQFMKTLNGKTKEVKVEPTAPSRTFKLKNGQSVGIGGVNKTITTYETANPEGQRTVKTQTYQSPLDFNLGLKFDQSTTNYNSNNQKTSNQLDSYAKGADYTTKSTYTPETGLQLGSTSSSYQIKNANDRAITNQYKAEKVNDFSGSIMQLQSPFKQPAQTLATPTEGIVLQ